VSGRAKCDDPRSRRAGCLIGVGAIAEAETKPERRTRSRPIVRQGTTTRTGERSAVRFAISSRISSTVLPPTPTVLRSISMTTGNTRKAVTPSRGSWTSRARSVEYNSSTLGARNDRYGHSDCNDFAGPDHLQAGPRREAGQAVCLLQVQVHVCECRRSNPPGVRDQADPGPS
jgi:hypothetical protein